MKKKLKESGVKGLSTQELMIINGGSHCPTHYLKDNYNAMADNGAFLVGFICGLLGI